MNNEEVARLIEEGLAGSKATVTGDGRHFDAVVVCEAFAGKSLLQKQRMVMNTVRIQIESDELHALSIKTFTPEEFNQSP